MMSNLYLASSYKNKIITLLLKNKNFIKLVNPEKIEGLTTQKVMLGGDYTVKGKLVQVQGHIFDYNFVDDTTTEKKTFVLVETDIDNVTDNIFTNFNLYICIFTSKDLVKITDSTMPTKDEVEDLGYNVGYFGNRIDILCDIVDKELNGTDKLKGIGDVRPASRGYVTMFCPNREYYGKCLKYHISNYNDGGDECGN